MSSGHPMSRRRDALGGWGFWRVWTMALMPWWHQRPSEMALLRSFLHPIRMIWSGSFRAIRTWPSDPCDGYAFEQFLRLRSLFVLRTHRREVIVEALASLRDERRLQYFQVREPIEAEVPEVGAHLAPRAERPLLPPVEEPEGPDDPHG